MKKDKGIGGLTIMLSIITMLFVIGLVVMIYSLMAGRMADTDNLYLRSGSISVANESISPTLAGVQVTSTVGKRSPICTLNNVYNGTTLLTNGNLTEVSECIFSNNSLYTAWKVSYTYNFLDDTGAVRTINQTSSKISSVTDWFDIFIVIGAMVFLIILVVLIMNAINYSGMVAGSPQQSSVGTA